MVRRAEFEDLNVMPKSKKSSAFLFIVVTHEMGTEDCSLPLLDWSKNTTF